MLHRFGFHLLALKYRTNCLFTRLPFGVSQNVFKENRAGYSHCVHICERYASDRNRSRERGGQIMK